MKLKQFFQIIWKDPVFSKVIAAGIVFFLGTLFFPLMKNIVPQLSSTVYFMAILAIGVFLIIFLLLAGRQKKRMLIYMSSGGTCRDPMAKAITLKLLEKRKLPFKLTIKAMASGPLSLNRASDAARFVIKKMYNEDLLEDHKPEVLTPEFIRKADLILLMDKHLEETNKKKLPEDITYVFKPFFGLEGDIEDPWRAKDEKNHESLMRYEKCANEIKQILEQNIDHLINVLDPLSQK